MNRLPLSGHRILELGRGLAAAYATRQLADVGAEVIQLGGRGELEPEGLNAQVHRNKYGCSLDPRPAASRELVLRLTALSNLVVIDDDQPGIGRDEIVGRNDDSIVLVMPGDHDLGLAVHEAARDWSSLQPASIVGMFAVAAAGMALQRRRMTGEGAQVTVSAAGALLSLSAARREAGPEQAATALPPDPAALLEDEDLKARAFFEPVARPGAGVSMMDGISWAMSRTPAHVRLPAPAPGEHDDYVLRTLLGLGDSEVAVLVAEGVVTPRPA
ncbi:MAG: hypothetical protein GEU28_00615 [Dehalococcoidia bacterium]|nr:hypothetical protein [Dehalococcoidia bacterium]